MPEIGPTPDMISDDLPTNPEYLDASFGAAGGFRELEDDDLDDNFYPEDTSSRYSQQASGTVISKVGGETIKMFVPAISVDENFFNTLPAGVLDEHDA